MTRDSGGHDWGPGEMRSRPDLAGPSRASGFDCAGDAAAGPGRHCQWNLTRTPTDSKLNLKRHGTVPPGLNGGPRTGPALALNSDEAVTGWHSVGTVTVTVTVTTRAGPG